MDTESARLYKIIIKDKVVYIRTITNCRIYIEQNSSSKAIEASINGEVGWLTQVESSWIFIVKETGRVRNLAMLECQYVLINDSQKELYSRVHSDVDIVYIPQHILNKLGKQS